MPESALSSLDHTIGPVFDALLAEGRMTEAMSTAMAAVPGALDAGLEEGRAFLWRRFFAPVLARDIGHYQCSDFEITDYRMGTVPGADALFRGPLPSAAALESGDYICLIGAAQFFGRFHTECLQTMIEARFGLPVLNLSIGGIGPQEFLAQPYPALASRARLTLVQVLSGRSVGCDEYPGGWRTTRKGETEPVPRETVLREIWERDRPEALRLIRKWAGIYTDHYDRLAGLCGDRAILVWMSDRMPEDWSEARAEETGDFGFFPQLVSADMVARAGAGFRRTVVCPVRRGEAFGFTSRFTGEACPCLWPPDGAPVWTSDYYPSFEANEAAFAALAPAIDEALS